MSFEDTKGNWESQDGWQFADRDAERRFFYDAALAEGLRQAAEAIAADQVDPDKFGNYHDFMAALNLKWDNVEKVKALAAIPSPVPDREERCEWGKPYMYQRCMVQAAGCGLVAESADDNMRFCPYCGRPISVVSA